LIQFASPAVSARPTSIRHWILTATTLAAFLMYLDRACLAWMLDSESFKSDIPLTKDQANMLKSAFFWAYALAQVPAGWLAERFGKRSLMTVLILLWSAFTALSGFANGLAMLVVARIGCGLAEAGAYPISGSLLSRWAHLNWRGFCSGIVSLGGRLGFVLAPLITVKVILLTGSWRWAGWSSMVRWASSRPGSSGRRFAKRRGSTRVATTWSVTSWMRAARPRSPHQAARPSPGAAFLLIRVSG